MKLRTQLNVIRVLAVTDWNASPETLRTSTLALMSSTINYSSPIWINSAHSNKIDVQFNTALRIIKGTLKSTPLGWLYVLSNIPQPDLIRKSYNNIVTNPIMIGNSLLYIILEEPVEHRLKSRRIWDETFKSVRNLSVNEEWRILVRQDQL